MLLMLLQQHPMVSFSYLMHLILDAVENELSPNMQSSWVAGSPSPQRQSGQFHE